MDISNKAVDPINHELLVPKLNACVLNKEAFKLSFSHLYKRKQSVRINKTGKNYYAVICVGANFSNIILKDLFLFLNKTGVCNFADDTTPFVCHRSLAELLEKLESNSELVIHWFEDNYMKLNSAKCHLFMSGH